MHDIKRKKKIQHEHEGLQHIQNVYVIIYIMCAERGNEEEMDKPDRETDRNTQTDREAGQ